MVVKIEIVKVYDKRKEEPRRVVIKKIEGVIEKEKLPADYLKKGPYFYRIDDWLEIYDENGNYIFSTRVNFGNKPEYEVEMSWSEFKKLVKLMREAGDRLHEINKRHRTEKELWETGEPEVIEI